MSGPTLATVSERRMRRLVSWVLPVTVGFLLAAGCFPW